MSKVTGNPGVDKVQESEFKKFVSLLFEEIVRTLNNGLDFSSNFNGSTVSITFAAANTDTSIAHGLNRVPTGYLVIGQSAAMSVYNGSAANTSTLLYLRSSATGTATVQVF